MIDDPRTRAGAASPAPRVVPGARPARRLVALLGMALAGCGAEVGAVPGSEPRAPTARLPSAFAELNGVTWTHLGSASAAAFTLGPVVEAPEGLVRHGCLFVHAPGSPEPFACIPALHAADRSDPVVVRAGAYLLELRPRAPRTWAEVTDEGELDVRLEGLP